MAIYTIPDQPHQIDGLYDERQSSVGMVWAVVVVVLVLGFLLYFGANLLDKSAETSLSSPNPIQQNFYPGAQIRTQ